LNALSKAVNLLVKPIDNRDFRPEPGPNSNLIGPLKGPKSSKVRFAILNAYEPLLSTLVFVPIPPSNKLCSPHSKISCCAENKYDKEQLSN